MMDRLEALERLAKLREKSVLSEEEFEAEKARLLRSQPASDQDEPESQTSGRGARILTLPLVALAVALLGGAYFGLSAPSGSGTQLPQSKPAVQPTVASTGSREAVRISSLMKFDDASACLPSEGLKVLLDELRALEPGPNQNTLPVGDTGGSVRPTVRTVEVGAGTGSIVSEVDVLGSWNGLKVSGLRTVRFVGSESFSAQIRFAEPAAKVQRALNAEGFSLPAVGELKNNDLDDGAGLSMGVESIRGGSALLCARSAA